MANVDWDKYAEQYDAITLSGANPAYRELLQKTAMFFKGISLKKGTLIADLGGGTGNFGLAVAELFPDSRLIILDSSSRMLEIAERKAEQRGLHNVEFIQSDLDEIKRLEGRYSQKVSAAIMIHALYAVRTRDDPEKPRRVLRQVYHCLEPGDSYLFLSALNRRLLTRNWIPYCLGNAYASFRERGSSPVRGFVEAVKFFRRNDQARLANQYIDAKQKEGSYLLCSLKELENMVRAAGFTRILEKSDRYYRGRDNLIIAQP